MYRVPDALALSPVVGKFTTQVRVGQFDLQFTFGPVSFAVQFPVNPFVKASSLGNGKEGRWPDPGFYDIMNATVRRCKVPND